MIKILHIFKDALVIHTLKDANLFKQVYYLSLIIYKVLHTDQCASYHSNTNLQTLPPFLQVYNRFNNYICIQDLIYNSLILLDLAFPYPCF